jgi:hypothetical protein
MRRVRLAAVVALLSAACTAGPAASTPTPTPGASPTPTPSLAATPADLSARPLAWFAPLPPMPTDPGRPFIGSEDFMDLFSPDAAWDEAAGRIGVFKLYGEWVAYHATIPELTAAVDEIARRGLVLAVEMGPLDPPAECGQGVESFAGIDEGQLISDRLRQAGGSLQVIALDEPYYFAHVYDGEGACGWSIDQVATATAGFTQAMRVEWPQVIVGDTEPMPFGVAPEGLGAWLDAYEAAAGEPLAFLHLDMDWGRSDWPQLGVAVEAVGAERGVPIGMIYNGGAATSDDAWLTITGQRVLAYEADAGANPAHVIFQSWMDKPDRVLPETEATSFTSFVNRYFDDRDSLGQLLGVSDNLALGRPAVASSALGDAGEGRAVDGDADTIWNAGVGPPAWIEIDLGSPRPLAEIRLMVSQSPGGTTHHRVSCAAAAGGAPTVLADLERATRDGEVIAIPVDGVVCGLIRVETIASPSWVAWREIEVVGQP